MGKKLAIRGHSTRGEEVIELLEMMGGKNIHKYDGEANMYSYYLFDYAILSDRLSIIEDDDFEIFTLEEFLEKYPFKINDRVVDKADRCPGIIDKMEWDESKRDMKYYVSFGYGADYGLYTSDKIKFYNKDMKTVNTVSEYEPVKSSAVKLVDGEVVDDLAKAKSDMVIDITNFMQMGKTVAVCFNEENYEAEVELQLGDYEIEVRDGKTYAVLKKPKYPTTYEECWKVRFEVEGETTIDEFHHVSGYYSEALGALQKLFCCRDAYWKIAGEEMGLDGPWKPDYTDLNSITYYGLFNELKYSIINPSQFIFPTVEMRDAFYKNFKYLIEICK